MTIDQPRQFVASWQPFDFDLLTEDVAPLKPGDEPTKKYILKGILQKADTLNQNGRVYPLSILEREVRNYQKFIIERRSMGECVPPGTEIYTNEGWKKIEEISDKEFIATLNTSTNELEFQRISRKIDIEYKGPMYRFKNERTYDMCLTPNHNVLLWDRTGKPKKISAQELYFAYQDRDSSISHSGLRRAGHVWNGENLTTISIAGKTLDANDWAAFLGIFLAEGHCSGVYSKSRKQLHTVVITQNKGETADKIRNLMTRLPWKFSERSYPNSKRLDFKIVDEHLHASLFRLGGSRNKFVPKYAKGWSTHLQTTLLEWMLLGDGRHRFSEKHQVVDEYCTSSPQLAQDVYDIMFKIGHGATINVYQPQDKHAPDFPETGRMILGENQNPMHIVSRSYSKGISLDFRFMQTEVIDYDGRVYCVTVPNGTWLMKYNGKVCWTSNCDHPDTSVVSVKNASHLVTEAVIKDGVVYGAIELLNTPSGKIIQSLVDSRVKLGISSRGVGSTKKQGDYQVVQEDFQLICWDIVAEPSTPAAFMIPEGKVVTNEELRRTFNRTDRIDRVLNEILRKG